MFFVVVENITIELNETYREVLIYYPVHQLKMFILVICQCIQFCILYLSICKVLSSSFVNVYVYDLRMIYLKTYEGNWKDDSRVFVDITRGDPKHLVDVLRRHHRLHKGQGLIFTTVIVIVIIVVIATAIVIVIVTNN